MANVSLAVLNAAALFATAATLTSVIMHADGVERLVWIISEERCPVCGYLLIHPIVKHEPGFAGLECGWR